MKVAVRLIPGSHPEYATDLQSSHTHEVLWSFQGRFNVYRDLATLVEKLSPSVMQGIPFPPTYASSSYGLKLSNAQLIQRKEGLEQWLQHFVDKFIEFHQDIIMKFYSIVTNTREEPSREEFGRFCLSFSNAPEIQKNNNEKLKIAPSGDWTTVTTAKKGVRREPTNILTVRVSRSSISNGHQQYETNIIYDKTARPFRMERVFKFYRKLALDLSELGINVGAIGDDEEGQSETVRRSSAVKNASGDMVEISLPPFPESFVISSFGIKLTETQLQQRCQKLHEWMRDLLCAFHLLPEQCQKVIINFLMLDEDETIHNLIINSLKNGWILNSHGELVASPIVEDNHSMTPTATMPPPSREISTRINNLVNMVHSKFHGTKKEDDDETKMVEPLTVQALQQQEENRRKQEMLIVQTIRGKEIQGHPSYETSLSTEAAHLLTVVKYFKDYRQLALNLSNQGVAVGTVEESQSVLSGVSELRRNSLPSQPSASASAAAAATIEGDLPPFPKTFRRSSIGMKLSEKDLQERCHGVDVWMTAVCQKYSQFSAESQLAINQFFQFDETNESHRLAVKSLTTGYVFNPHGIVSSPPGTLSQISEEILSPEPVKSQLSPFEASTDSPSATTSAPAKRKSIVDFFSPKAAGQKLKEAISHLPDSETMSPKSVIDDNDQERLKIEEENCTLLINLTRAGNINSHPAYEVTLSCKKENTRHNVTYQFKDYRQLALQLEKEGINVGTIGQDENENSNSEKSPTGSTHGELDLPPFPRTYALSAFGIKLSEAELQARADGLDRWIRAVCQKYHLFPGVVQHHIEEFLKLDPVSPSHYLILRSLSVGWVAINPSDSLPPQPPPQSTRRNSALGKLFQPMTSRDEINEADIPVTSTTDDDDWVDINSKNNSKTNAEPALSPQSTTQQQASIPQKTENRVSVEAVREEEEEDILHITPAIKTPSGCMPGLCLIS